MVAVNKMKVHVTLKSPSKTQVETKIRLVVFAIDIVSIVKERIADVLNVPFPEQDLVFGGASLSDSQKIFDSGIKDGSSLEFVVKASEASLECQLTELMPAGTEKMSSDELGMMYALKHGTNVSQALQLLGIDGQLKQFLSQSKHFDIDAQGQVSLLRKACTRIPTAHSQPTNEEEEEDLVDSGTCHRIDRLGKLFHCVEDLRSIEKEIDRLTNMLGGCAALGKLAPVAEVDAQAMLAESLPSPWYKKESSKHQGRFFDVNKDTGATSWKLPVSPQLPLAAAVPPPPGLENMMLPVVKPPPGLEMVLQAPPGLSLPTTAVRSLPRSSPIPLSLINEIPAAMSLQKDKAVISLAASLDM
jgi:hypothetical protein